MVELVLDTRAGNPSSSKCTGAPLASSPSIVTSVGRSTGMRTGPSETAILARLELCTRRRDTGFTSTSLTILVVEDEEAPEDADLCRGL